MNNVPLSCESSVIVYDTALVIHSIDVFALQISQIVNLLYSVQLVILVTLRNCCELNLGDGSGLHVRSNYVPGPRGLCPPY